MILDGKYLLLKRNQYHQIFPMLYKMGYVWPTHFLDYDLSGIDFLYKRFEFLSITTYDDNKTLSVCIWLYG